MDTVTREHTCIAAEGDMIQVTSTVPASGDGEVALVVESHWNDPALVVIKLGAMETTVNAVGLQAAITNAINTARWH